MSYLSFLKQRNPIAEVSKRLGLKIHQSNKCPFCGHNSFRITSANYRCFHPACSEKGDILTLLVKLRVATDFKAAVRLLVGGQDWVLQNWCNKNKLLAEVYGFYKKEAEKHRGLIEQHLKSRALPMLDCGLALESSGVLEHFSLEHLQAAGLTSKRDKPLFYNHLVFPYKDLDGQVIYLQGRNLDNSSSARWVSGTSQPNQPPISSGLYGIEEEVHSKAIIVCEGVYDRAAIKSLGFPAVGTAGLFFPFELYAEFFGAKREITLLYDNDRYPSGSPKAGEFKSWPSVIKSILKVYTLHPELRIKCLTVPAEHGKDANDWLQAGLTRDQFLRSLKCATDIETFAIQHLRSKEDLPTVLQILKVNKKEEHLSHFQEDRYLVMEMLFDLCEQLCT